MKSQKTFACVTGCDLQFLVGTRAMLTTARHFHPEVTRYCFTHLDQVQEIQAALGGLANVLAIPRSLTGVPTEWMPSYSRLFIPEIIREDVVAWVDSDAIFVGRADHLWDVVPDTVNVTADLYNHISGMVRAEGWSRYVAAFPQFNPEDRGFNAGVYALRPTDWPNLAQDFEIALANLSFDPVPFYADQLVLNGIFRAEARYMSNQYNAHAFLEPSIGLPHDVRIIHYASSPKPWQTSYPKMTWPFYYWEKCATQRNSRHLALIQLKIFLSYPFQWWSRLVRKVRHLMSRSIA